MSWKIRAPTRPEVALRLPRRRSTRQIIDVFVSPRRNIASAKSFFRRALDAHREPDEVVTDLAQARETTIEELIPNAFHNTEQYANIASSAITADLSRGSDPCADSGPTGPRRS